MPDVLPDRRLSEDEKARVVSAAARAGVGSAWYSDQLRASGFDRTGEFDSIPVTTEAGLADGYYGAGPEHDHGASYATSGTTTGTGRTVLWPQADDARYVEHRAALFRSLFGSSCRTACADLGTGHAQASALRVFAAVGLDAHEIDIDTPVERHVEALREWRPDLLYTMPVILERIVGAGGPGYVPVWIVVLGDVAPPAWRRSMERRLGMQPGRIVDVFGSIEVGAIAYSDDQKERHLFHEHIVPEVIRPQNERTDCGELLVLTSTERDGFPAVRYASGDIVSGLRAVDVAGTRRWAFDAHLGRVGTLIKHGEALSLTVMTERIAAVAPGMEWAVRREGMEVVIEIDESGYSAVVAAEVRRAVRVAHPAVDALIRSGLIGDIRVEPRALAATGSKRSIR